MIITSTLKYLVVLSTVKNSRVAFGKLRRLRIGIAVSQEELALAPLRIA